MTNSIVTLTASAFYTRVALSNCLLNIGGETKEVRIEVHPEYRHQNMKAVDPVTEQVLCTFCAWHMIGGPDMFQIEGASMNGEGYATLIVVPSLCKWEGEENEDD